MRNGQKSKNRAINSAETALNSLESIVGAVSSISRPVKRIFWTGAAAIAFFLLGKGLYAQPIENRTETLKHLRQYAIMHESSDSYRKLHEADLLVGFSHEELVRALGIMDAYAGKPFNVPLLYRLSSGPAGKKPDEDVDLNTDVSIELGTEPVLLKAYDGHNLYESLDQLVNGSNKKWFKPFGYFAEADAETRSDILDAMHETVKAMGLGDEFSAARSETDYVELPKEILLKAGEARMGVYKKAPAEKPAPTEPAVQSEPVPYIPPEKALKQLEGMPIPDDDFPEVEVVTEQEKPEPKEYVPVKPPVQPPVVIIQKKEPEEYVPVKPSEPETEPVGPQCSDGIDNDGDGVADGYDPECGENPYWDDESAAYVPEHLELSIKEEYEDSEEPVEPEPVRPQCSDGIDNDGDGVADGYDPECQKDENWDDEAEANSCDDPAFENTLRDIRENSYESIDNNEQGPAIGSSAKAKYDALAKKCPARDGEIDEDREHLAGLLKEYACEDPQMAKSLGEINKKVNGLKSKHADQEDIRKAANEGFDKLIENCPDNGLIDPAMAAFEKDLKQYVEDEANRVKNNLFNIGGGFMQGDAVNHTASGNLLIGMKNSKDATKPFSLEWYLNGGKYKVEGVKKEPFGGTILSVSGKNYDLKLSWFGKALSSASSYSIPPITREPVTEDITIEDGQGNEIVVGTRTTTETESEDSSSSTEGYMLNDWLASGELTVALPKDLELDVGFAYGRYTHHDRTETHNTTVTNEVEESHDDGPPASDVRSENDTTVNADIVTNTDVLTQLIVGKAGLLYKVESKKGRFKMGGDLTFFYNKTEISGDVIQDIETIVGDTITDIYIEGQPDMREITEGTTTQEPATVIPHDVADESSYTFLLRPRMLFDKEKMALRLEVGPVITSGNLTDNEYQSAMPVGGNVTGLFDVHGYTLGGNVLIDGDVVNMSFLFTTTGFPQFVDYVDTSNQMAAGLVHDKLRNSYLDNLFGNLVAASDGVILDLGMSIDSEADFAFSPKLAYMHQFAKAGLGASVNLSVDKVDPSGVDVRTAAYIGMPNGWCLKLEYATEHDDIADERVHGGYFSLVRMLGADKKK